MANKTKKVGGMSEVGDKRGKMYSQQYFLDSTDKATYEALLIFQDPANTSPYEFPAGTYFYKWDFKPYADHWLLIVDAAEEGWFEELGMKKIREAHGYRYQQKFYFPTDERSTYEDPLEYHKAANVAPYEFPSDSYFRNWEFEPLGDTTSLFIETATEGFFMENWAEGEKKGNKYTKEFIVKESDRALYEGVIKWMAPASNLPLTFPVDTFIYQWKWTQEAEHWVLTVIAATGEYFDESSIRGASAGKENKILKYFAPDLNMVWNPEWWGVRQATYAEAGYVRDNDTGLYTPPERSEGNGTTLSSYVNIYGEPCELGDWLFPNCTLTDAGEPDFEKAPFKPLAGDDLTLDHMPVSLIGMQMNILMYTLTYYIKESDFDVNDLSFFIGANGEFPSGAQPLDTQYGRWLAVDQKYDYQSATNRGGISYYRITRQCKHVPMTPNDTNFPILWKNDIAWEW